MCKPGQSKRPCKLTVVVWMPRPSRFLLPRVKDNKGKAFACRRKFTSPSMRPTSGNHGCRLASNSILIVASGLSIVPSYVISNSGDTCAFNPGEEKVALSIRTAFVLPVAARAKSIGGLRGLVSARGCACPLMSIWNIPLVHRPLTEPAKAE